VSQTRAAIKRGFHSPLVAMSKRRCSLRRIGRRSWLGKPQHHPHRYPPPPSLPSQPAFSSHTEKQKNVERE
jgi:hypothetical protein